MISRKKAMRIDDAKEIICNYLYKNKVDFSLKILGGGYTYNNETFDHESTISLLFIGGDYPFVQKIAKNLKMILEQEVILIVRRDIEVAYL